MMEKAALPGAVFVCGLVLTRLFRLKTRDQKPKRAFNSAALRVAPASPAFRHKKTADENQRSDLLLAPFVGNRLYVKSLAGGMASAARRQPLKKGEKKKAYVGERTLPFRRLPGCGEDSFRLLTMLIILKKNHLSSHFTQIIKKFFEHNNEQFE